MKRQSEGAFTSRRARRHPRPRPGHRRYHRRGPLQREREVTLIAMTQCTRVHTETVTMTIVRL